MIGGVWQIILLILVACLAAKMLIELVTPMVPALIAIGVTATLVGGLVKKKRRF